MSAVVKVILCVAAKHRKLEHGRELLFMGPAKEEKEKEDRLPNSTEQIMQVLVLH